jgi:hypothetical protein
MRFSRLNFKTVLLVHLSVAMEKICKEISFSFLWLTHMNVLHTQNMCVFCLIPIEIQQVVLFTFLVFLFSFGMEICLEPVTVFVL